MNRLEHPLNRWNSRRPSYTWLGDVRFPLLTLTCPHIILNTTPSTKMISHGSIIHQKNPASSVGTSMLITVPGMMMYLQTLELCTSQMDGSALRALLNDGSPTQAYIRRPTATPKRIGSSSAIALTTVSMQCHLPSPCPNVWRPYVTS